MSQAWLLWALACVVEPRQTTACCLHSMSVRLSHVCPGGKLSQRRWCVAADRCVPPQRQLRPRHVQDLSEVGAVCACCSAHSTNPVTTQSPTAGVTRAAPCPALPPPAPASWRSPRSKQGSQGGRCSAQSALQSSGLAGPGASAAMLADACSQLMHLETRQARSASVAQPAQKQWHLQTPLARARCQRLAQ